jgi:hypothetical protein
MTTFDSYGIVEVRANVHVKVVGGSASIVSGQVSPSRCGGMYCFLVTGSSLAQRSESRDGPLEQ